jgi:hypothetical protein
MGRQKAAALPDRRAAAYNPVDVFLATFKAFTQGGDLVSIG